MTAQTPFIGIDFGTSKSCMAWVKPNGEAEVLKNAEGEDKTPSVVYFGAGGEVLVGSPAEELLADETERVRVVSSVKRELVNAPTLALPGGKRVKPVEVAAAVLRKLRLDAETGHFHQPVLKAVITCPAEFDPLQRDEIAKAGKLAGFAEVALLEEPVAAGLAYRAAGQAVGDHVLVYDLGGGTFDLAVLMRDAAQGYRLALEPRGIQRCGGDDFDRALYDHLDEVAAQELGRPIAPDDRLDKGFLHACRAAKEALTARGQTRVTAYLPSAGGMVQFKHVVERALFEELVRERVEKTVRLTKTLLQEAKAAGCAVDTVVLIGGSARVPLVIKQLQAALPVAPHKWEKQDVAVALGAAYHAARLWDAQVAAPVVEKPAPAPVAEPQPQPQPQAAAPAAEEKSAPAAAPQETTGRKKRAHQKKAAQGSAAGDDFIELEEAREAAAEPSAPEEKPAPAPTAPAPAVGKRAPLPFTFLNIYKLLPGGLQPPHPKANCMECGLPTCLAFASRVAAEERDPSDCAYLSDEARVKLGVAPAPGGAGAIATAAGKLPQAEGRKKPATEAQPAAAPAPVAAGQPEPATDGRPAPALTFSQIYKLLPGGLQPPHPKANCMKCGLPTCLAFASRVAAEERDPSECAYLSDEARVKLGVAPAPEAWQKQSSASPTVTVAADGRGDYASLEKALAEVPPGATIRLLAGEHELTKALVVTKELHLVGAGMEATTVVGAANDSLVKVTGVGSLDATGITFRRRGGRGSVMEARDGRLELTECRLTKSSYQSGFQYDGLEIAGSAAAKISRCRIENHEGSGILVHDQAQPTLEDNTCQGNKLHGISFEDSAAGVARRNLCVGNGNDGIRVGGKAWANLEENTCKENGWNGIIYMKDTTGVARLNQCSTNGGGSWLWRLGQEGIHVSGGAQVVLESNKCFQNLGYGIISPGGKQSLGSNECSGNKMGSIR